MRRPCLLCPILCLALGACIVEQTPGPAAPTGPAASAPAREPAPEESGGPAVEPAPAQTPAPAEGQPAEGKIDQGCLSACLESHMTNAVAWEVIEHGCQTKCTIIDGKTR